MIPVRSVVVLTLALVLPLLAGCDDDVPPDLKGLEPLTLALQLDELRTPLQASTVPIANLRGALPLLNDSGITLLPPDFPAGVAGETFAYDLATDSWGIDESLTGAPSNGIALLWYALDGTGEFVTPLEQEGRIELHPVSGGTTDSLALTVTRSAAGSPETLLDFVQGLELTGGSVSTESVRAAGTYSNGTATVAFSLLSDVTIDTVADDESYELQISLEGGNKTYDLAVEGSVTGASGDGADLLTATVVHEGAATILEMSFSTDGETGAEDASGTLVHQGELVASIAVVGNSYRFLTPEGGDFHSDQAYRLNTLFTALTRTGFLVLLNLPLFMP